MIKQLGTPNVTGNENVTQLFVKAVNESEKTIIADCLDADGNIVSADNWFIYSGTGKNVPFTLTKAEITAINK